MDDRPTFDYEGRPVRAAGILVWTRKDGQVHRLFRRIKKKYEDIGGKTDLADKSALDTAIRETVEETHGKLFCETDTPENCAAKLRQRLHNVDTENIEYNKISKYILFKMEVHSDILLRPMTRFGLSEQTDWGALEHYYQWRSKLPYHNQLHYRLRGMRL
jgi:hypothetical protein